jgi:hypothetical protein
MVGLGFTLHPAIGALLYRQLTRIPKVVLGLVITSVVIRLPWHHRTRFPPVDCERYSSFSSAIFVVATVMIFLHADFGLAQRGSNFNIASSRSPPVQPSN